MKLAQLTFTNPLTRAGVVVHALCHRPLLGWLLVSPALCPKTSRGGIPVLSETRRPIGGLAGILVFRTF